ncbi:uncharacterized protein LOC128722136 [Anopheles nili]|uniref:uncharacterized protein LOC128722136 n=1 Tax=Anopheles nili TaxID=185578 RepID=UPI00237C2DCE|nr:uncharacterized protein LOC128722136 [Anopheles nili]
MSAPELGWQVVRDIGAHRFRMGNVGGAIDNFLEAAPKVSEDGDESLAVSKAKAELEFCEPQNALETVRKATNYPANLLQSRALYGTGELEQHLLASSNGQRRQRPVAGHRQQDFTAEVDLALSTFDCTLGTRAGASLLEYRHRFREIAAEQRELRERAGDRPRWKVLAEAGECDVISLLETVRKEPPLRERERRKRNRQILGQLHLGRGWEDWMFIEQLLPSGRHGSTVRLPQTRQSSRAMDELIDECFSKVSARVQNAQACLPMYSHRHGRFGPQSNHRRELFDLDELLKWRYQAYRAVYSQFDRLYELRERGRTVELVRFVGEALDGFYKTTTVRVFPEKSRVIRELCNLAGLTILDELRIPPSLMDAAPEDRLLLLFAVPPAKESQLVVPVFGDIATYRDPTEPDHGYLRYKAKIAELERRYHRVQYPIERCLIDYQMARQHLLNGWLDDVKVMGNRMIDEAIGCGSNLWQLIGLLTLARACCAQNNLEQLTVQLRLATELVESRLPDERVDFFIEVSQKLCREMLMKKLGTDRSQSLVLDRTVLA